jgi:hypothetical protein
VVDDAAKRKELYERLLFALDGRTTKTRGRQAVAKPAVRREYEVIRIKEVAEVAS